MTNSNTRATTRTWITTTDYRVFDEHWGSETNTVTLTRTPSGLVAEVDGELVSVERAVRLLNGASRTEVVSEVLDNDAAAPFHAHRAQSRAHIARRMGEGMSGWQAVQEAAGLRREIGKFAACELHRELGRLGFRNHYETAGEVLGRPVPSLAALSEEEAYTVRDYARGQWGLTA